VPAPPDLDKEQAYLEHIYRERAQRRPTPMMSSDNVDVDEWSGAPDQDPPAGRRG
jgi:hypothetical protein